MYFNNPINATEIENQLNDYAFALKECTKPSYKIETSQHVLINHTLNYPKNVVWQPITVKMISALNAKSSVGITLKKILTASGYNNPRQYQSQQISKSLLLFQSIELIQIDEDENTVEAWSLLNPFITDVNYGSLAYENESFVDITFNISYDYAELNNVSQSEAAKTIDPLKTTSSPRASVSLGEAEGRGVIIRGRIGV